MSLPTFRWDTAAPAVRRMHASIHLSQYAEFNFYNRTRIFWHTNIFGGLRVQFTPPHIPHEMIGIFEYAK